MRFAESAGSRWVLALSTLVTAALAVRAWPAHHHERRSPVTPYHGCGVGHRVAQVEPAPQVQAEDPYVATLRSVRGELEACMANHADIQVRLAIDIAPSGRVENVEVKALAADVAKIDLHMVKCVQTAVSPLQFPAASDPKRISTFLNK